MENKHILITGASGDIGSYISEAFLAKGCLVTGVDIANPKTECDNKNFVFKKCDLTQFDETQSVLDALVNDRGVFDVVINNAGTIANAPIVNLIEGKMVCHDPKVWEKVIHSNLFTAFYTSSIASKHMITKRKKGVIINISSISSNGNPGQAAYSSAKAGVIGLTMTLAKELGVFGIRSVAVAPGFFDTHSTRAHVNEARLKTLTGATPIKKLGNLADLQKTLEYIINTDFINGKVIQLDGGLVI